MPSNHRDHPGMRRFALGSFSFFAFGPRVLILPPTSVGYIVTAGYILRAVAVPSVNLRRFIWGTSILVQGVWLCVGIHDMTALRPNLLLLWWLFATVCSVVAIATERD